MNDLALIVAGQVLLIGLVMIIFGIAWELDDTQS